MTPNISDNKLCKLEHEFLCQAPKSTRKRDTPENADSRNGQVPAFSGVLRFRVLFVLL